MLVQSMISFKLTLTIVISLSNLVIKLTRNSDMTGGISAQYGQKDPEKCQALGYL